jgi:hypothetical protein
MFSSNNQWSSMHFVHRLCCIIHRRFSRMVIHEFSFSGTMGWIGARTTEKSQLPKMNFSHRWQLNDIETSYWQTEKHLTLFVNWMERTIHIVVFFSMSSCGVMAQIYCVLLTQYQSSVVFIRYCFSIMKITFWRKLSMCKGGRAISNFYLSKYCIVRFSFFEECKNCHLRIRYKRRVSSRFCLIPIQVMVTTAICSFIFVLLR